MSRSLTVELPDDIHDAVARAAAIAGTTSSEWVAQQLKSQLQSNGPSRVAQTSPGSGSLADDPLRRLFGSIHGGDPHGSSNDRIDADLAREYGDTHDEES